MTKENLYQKYIVENIRLKDMPLLFSEPISKIRRTLLNFGIKKSQEQAVENSKKTGIERYDEKEEILGQVTYKVI